MRIYVERMIKHSIQLNNLTVKYLHKNDACIEIYRIKAFILLFLLSSYMYICNDIQKKLLIYTLCISDIFKDPKTYSCEDYNCNNILILNIYEFHHKKMPLHSLNTCNFLKTLTMASELKITSLVNTLIYTKTGF